MYRARWKTGEPQTGRKDFSNMTQEQWTIRQEDR